MKKGETEKELDNKIQDMIEKREAENEALKKLLHKLNEEEKKPKSKKRK